MKARSEGPKNARKRAPRKRGAGRRPTIEDGAQAAALVGALVCGAVVIATAIVVISTPRNVPEPLSQPVVQESTIRTESMAAEERTPAEEEPPSASVHETMPAAAPEAAPRKEPPTPASRKEPIPVPRREPIQSPPKEPVAAAPIRPKAPVERPRPPRKGQVAFVIDDAGNNLRELEPFLALPGPLTIAVLPGLPHSAEAARRARAAGKEVILHQPMEALGGQYPGPGALEEGMDAAGIRAVLAKNVAEIGPIVGMNNHQGSKTTEDRKMMETVLAFCRDNGLYYLDSRTTADTVVPAVAAGMGIRIRERDVFVDNIQEKAAMIRFVQEGLQKAEKKGAAVMIGHAWSSELADTLRELYPELVEQGFSLSTISRIMMGTWDEDEGLGD